LATYSIYFEKLNGKGFKEKKITVSKSVPHSETVSGFSFKI